jgi:NAD-dependent SIR2 family protein deacetylase
MIARLSELSQAATPTPFHRLLRLLDVRGKLLRVYTQNIDAIEVKSGLSFGVPEFDLRRKSRPRRKPIAPDLSDSPPSVLTRLPSPPEEETPRCVPLHGTLQTLHCQTCNHSFPLDDHLPSLTCGTPPGCPECIAMEATRQLVGKRSRGVGRLRPSVVLYNESHKDGEGVGEVVRRDLVGTSKGKGRSGADLLLVVGTSLRVPGTKRIVREFAKAVHSRAIPSSSSPSPVKEVAPLGLLTPSPSPRRSPSDEEPPVKSIYLNLDFPVPTREWEGVFDVWVQGDAQEFAQRLIWEIEKETKSREDACDRKRKRENTTHAGRRGKRRSKAFPGSPTKEAAERRKSGVSPKAKLPSLIESTQLKLQISPEAVVSSPNRKFRIPPRTPRTPGSAPGSGRYPSTVAHDTLPTLVQTENHRWNGLSESFVRTGFDEFE